MNSIETYKIHGTISLEKSFYWFILNIDKSSIYLSVIYRDVRRFSVIISVTYVLDLFSWMYYSYDLSTIGKLNAKRLLHIHKKLQLATTTISFYRFK